MKKVALGTIVGAAALLAVMGLVFCWMCQHPFDTWSSHWMFKRTIVFNVMGLSLGGIAAAIGWRWWLKFAPVVVVVWVWSVFSAVMWSPIEGNIDLVRLGPVVLCVWDAIPLIVGLVAAWISWKCNFRSFVTMLILTLSFAAFFGMKIVTNENRMQRVKAFFDESAEKPVMDATAQARCYLQTQSAAIIREAKWIGKTELDPKALPCAATAAMPAKAAAMFGKWYLVHLCGLFGLMSAGFAMAWVSVGDNARRSLVLAQGLTIVGTMVVSFLGCLHLTPMLMCGIPWASFGGSMAALAWLALGVLASAMLDKNELVTARVNGGQIWQAVQ